MTASAPAPAVGADTSADQAGLEDRREQRRSRMREGGRLASSAVCARPNTLRERLGLANSSTQPTKCYEVPRSVDALLRRGPGRARVRGDEIIHRRLHAAFLVRDARER